jgi:hypothetical protein
MSQTRDPVFFSFAIPATGAGQALHGHGCGSMLLDMPSRSSMPRRVGGLGFKVFIGTAAPPVSAAALRGWSLLLSTLPRGRLEAAGSSDDGGSQSVEGHLAGLGKVQTPAEHSMARCLCLPTIPLHACSSQWPRTCSRRVQAPLRGEQIGATCGRTRRAGGCGGGWRRRCQRQTSDRSARAS